MNDVYITEYGPLEVEPSTPMLEYVLEQIEQHDATYGASLMKALGERHAKHSNQFMLKHMHYADRNFVIVTGDDHLVYVQMSSPEQVHTFGFTRVEWDGDIAAAVKEQAKADDAVSDILLTGKKPYRSTLATKPRNAKQTAVLLFDRLRRGDKPQDEQARNTYAAMLDMIRTNEDSTLGEAGVKRFQQLANSSAAWMSGQIGNSLKDRQEYTMKVTMELIDLMLRSDYHGEVQP